MFIPEVNLHTIPDRFDFIYYSFGMMRELGATGIAAVTDQARSVSRIEAIPGQLYLAVLISRLVGAYRFTQPGANSWNAPRPGFRPADLVCRRNLP